MRTNKNILPYFSASILILLTCSCKRLAFTPEPKADQVAVYDFFIKTVKANYGLFQYKGINIDTFGNNNRKIVSLSTSQEQLFAIISNQLKTLKDGHNSVNSFGKFSTYNFVGSAPENGAINLTKYVNFGPPQGIIEYREMKNPDLGYINIDSFDGKKSDFELIDKALESFKDKKGIIIDVRGNGGGNSDNSEIVASRFADKNYTYGKIKVKLGPEKDNFSLWTETKIAPKGKSTYVKPVVILTNRKCFSATEVFLMIMQNFPNVRIVGDATGGGIGGPVPFELPNGWGIRLSTKLWTRPDGSSPEGIGIIPDYPISNGIQKENDTILEKAIDLLK